ncbi:MAG: aminopeptidase P family protein [Halocynthiibacter sp.]
MYQSYETRTHPADGPPRLAKLRAALTRHQLDGFLVPRADAHQGEYVAPHDERLSWLSGFTGSAGFCAALKDRAGVFVDGRYRLQVRDQVDCGHFTPVPWPETKLGEWLKKALPAGGIVGYDPWLHSHREIDRLTRSLTGSGVTLRQSENLIDAIWTDQPAAPAGPVVPYPTEFAGDDHTTKRTGLAAKLRAQNHKAAVLSLPDSIAWLLNVRGADVAHVPVAHAFAILRDDGQVDLFIAPEKLDEAARSHLAPDIVVHPPDALQSVLSRLSGPVLLDNGSVPMQLVLWLRAAAIDHVFAQDPCILPKACKHPAEIAGAEAAHLRDGAAMVEFLSWLDVNALTGGLTEIDVARKLEDFRRANGKLRDISFETISATGPHGAIVHYRVTDTSNQPVLPGQLLLVDSGAQYLDGTTDITRTIAVGAVGDQEKTCFTRVLQGMIAISRARWPVGLAGRDIDAIARYPLWLAGQDYDHGTGHGVGAYLSVHEGPARLSRLSDQALLPGMILSNEPGYYREGAFGIRIENLIVIEKATTPPGGDARPMLSTRTLTHVPIDRNLIRAAMLTGPERDWLNAYHHETHSRLAKRVSDPARVWLKRATAPI